MRPVPPESSRVLRFVISTSLFLTLTQLPLQSQTKPTEGLRNNTPKVHALLNARVVTSPENVIDKGCVVLRDGIIEAVGADVTPPADARVWDYSGLTVYPGLIDAFAQLKPAEKQEKDAKQAATEDTHARYWNPLVRPEKSVLDGLTSKPEELEKLRKLGFTTALLVPGTGIFRGQSVLLNLGGEAFNSLIINGNLSQHVAFETTGSDGKGYPTSLMGAIAVIRQALLDAQWYGQAHAAYRVSSKGQARPEENKSLQALYDARHAGKPFVFEVTNDLNLLRALRLTAEFRLNSWILGSGHEYRILDELQRSKPRLTVPLNFPDAPDVSTPEKALSVSLQQLAHWEIAPANPAILHNAGVSFALTTATLKNRDDFYPALRKALQAGLPPETALAALTTVPAAMLGVEKQLGSIEVGKVANLLVTRGDLFAEGRDILDVWISGKRYEIKVRPETDPRGTWQATIQTGEDEQTSIKLKISGKIESLSGKILLDSTEIGIKQVDLDLKRLSLVFDGQKLGFDGYLRLSATLKKERLSGSGELPTGKIVGWQAVRLEPYTEDSVKAVTIGDLAPTKTAAQQPPGAYGLPGPPVQPHAVLVRGGTLWTCGPQSKLTGDLLVVNGKIKQVGANLKAPANAVIIDATGKHVTPGLIDAHSHSAVSHAVNEVGQAVTAEVRITDVINSYDIAIYRELAGGLTVANQLHGSANPIGGQSSVIKLRWGATPDQMRFKGAMPGIKFALGENVKQSNWGDDFTKRYPQTRMGVEQLIRDRFKAALDYERKWQTYSARKKQRGVIPPRRDLELETLLEILHGERLVHSHSYRQDEILMLVRIADDFGFTMGTFQHVLEGYKIAEALAVHGASASTFSDWWAYKFEVYDAIPYNGALMRDAGVTVSFNSDSAELARRLNQEAAKAVKYGGVPEEEALKFVTLNPAKQLGIDNRVGSLEPGKDADFVIWSGHPLSPYSRCEQTWLDGRKYFDIETDLDVRQQITRERVRLIQKVLAEEKKSNNTSESGESNDPK